MNGDVREFDYIVVGGGSAGCVLANRLSADAQTTVCLIEAGPPDSTPLINVPMGLLPLLRGQRYNWAYETAPQAALDGRRLYWPRGKTLGGSSAINAMIYTRGVPADYDGWARAGCPGWGWHDVLPLFMHQECQQRGAGPTHGAFGALHVGDLLAPNPLSRAFVEAGVEAGLPRRADFNGPDGTEGVGMYQVTQLRGRRWSAARAFLDPVRGRGNLTVLTDALATRVLFEHRRARGVRVRDAAGEHDLHARAEVVLCAGAVNTPQLLLCSGVGDGAQLQRLGVPVVLDLPEVGRNLQDHLDITVGVRERGALAVGIGARMLPRLLREALRWRRDGAGLFASNAAESGGFARSDPALDRPDLQFHFVPSLLRDHGRRLVPGYGYTLHVCQLYPHSRGRIELTSPDPAAPPRIDPDYLSDPRDLPVLRAGLRLARRILGAPALARHARAELWPGAATQDEGALDAFIRAGAETIYHPVGTCRMGSDAAAVVDSHLRVRGVDALRVADASVMPTLIGGNTNAPSMMIGEMASRFLLGRGPQP